MLMLLFEIGLSKFWAAGFCGPRRNLASIPLSFHVRPATTISAEIAKELLHWDQTCPINIIFNVAGFKLFLWSSQEQIVLVYSSVARGGGGEQQPSPLAWRLCKIPSFFALLRPICPQNPKIATSPLRLGREFCKGPDVISSWIWYCNHLHLDRATDLISAKNFPFFFLEITWIWQKNCLNLIQDWWKFGSSSFAIVSSYQKSPPPPLQNPGYAPACLYTFLGRGSFT